MSLDGHYTTDNLKQLLRCGASFSINAEPFTLQDLCGLARNAKAGGGRLTINFPLLPSIEDMSAIARNGRGHVVLSDDPAP